MHSAWNTLFYYDPEPRIRSAARDDADGDRELPLVWTHRSGRKSLVIGADCARTSSIWISRRAPSCWYSCAIGRLSRSSFIGIRGRSAIS